MSFAPRRRCAAFTLIELLVVVAIISLLVSMLMPALRAARDQSQQLLCQTNMRSMGQAAYFYAEDNRDWLVQSESLREKMCFITSVLPGLGYEGPTRELWDSGATNEAREKRRRLMDICESTKQLNCPKFPNANQPYDYVVNAFIYPYTRSGGDGPGDHMGDGPANAAPTLPRSTFIRRSDLDKPAMRVYVMEAHQEMPTTLNNWNMFTDVFIPKHLPFATAPRIANDQRHPGGIDSLFFDGHVSSIPLLRFDPGWPNNVSDRLRLLTDVIGE